jgi:hypothetical protein
LGASLLGWVLLPAIGIRLINRIAPKSRFIGVEIVLAAVVVAMGYALCRQFLPWFPNLLLL